MKSWSAAKAGNNARGVACLSRRRFVPGSSAGGMSRETTRTRWNALNARINFGFLHRKTIPKKLKDYIPRPNGMECWAERVETSQQLLSLFQTKYQTVFCESWWRDVILSKEKHIIIWATLGQRVIGSWVIVLLSLNSFLIKVLRGVGVRLLMYSCTARLFACVLITMNHIVLVKGKCVPLIPD